MGGILVAGMKVSDMLSFEVGVGYIVDDPKDADNGFDEKTKAYDVYLKVSSHWHRVFISSPKSVTEISEILRKMTIRAIKCTWAPNGRLTSKPFDVASLEFQQNKKPGAICPGFFLL